MYPEATRERSRSYSQPDGRRGFIKWGHAGDKKKFVLEKSESVIWLSDCRYLFRKCR